MAVPIGGKRIMNDLRGLAHATNRNPKFITGGNSRIIRFVKDQHGGVANTQGVVQSYPMDIERWHVTSLRKSTDLELFTHLF
jgi:hypothetical protein